MPRTRAELLAVFRPIYAAAKRIDEREHHHGRKRRGSRRLEALCEAICLVEARLDEETQDWTEWEKPPGPAGSVYPGRR